MVRRPHSLRDVRSKHYDPGRDRPTGAFGIADGIGDTDDDDAPLKRLARVDKLWVTKVFCGTLVDDARNVLQPVARFC
jgi:hypothetical protein